MKQFVIKYIVEIVLVALALAGLIWFATRKSDKSYTGIDGLAKCLKDKGAKFYGTSTCPHCNNQKAMFGDAAKELPYIECNTNKACSDAGITAYPTWVFYDGTKQMGEISLEQLKQLSGCK